MKISKKTLLTSLAVFAVAFGVIIYVTASASGTAQVKSESVNRTEAPAVEPVQEQTNSPEISESSIEATQSAPDAPEAVQTYQQPSEPQTTPQAQPQQEMERIPFTNKPVEAGNPESYVDTYGQCPFYENAGPKGCFPPPDIECNADWSVCTYKGE